MESIYREYHMKSLDNLPTIKEVLRRYDLHAKKKLSQNFLLDLNITTKIARSCPNLSESTILEVGPGPGALTRGLLIEKARKIYAIEKDARFLPALDDVRNAYPGRLEVINGDALNHKILENLTPPVQIFSNLPYNIGTELLTNWLDPPKWPPRWETLTLMLQKEVAERLVAAPNSKEYGRLSILTQWRNDVKIILRLPAKIFLPIPKVDSAVVQIKHLKVPKFEVEYPILKKIVAKAFNQRRKMLRSSLKGISPDLSTKLKEAKISPTKRAEEISIKEFCNLAKIIGSIT